MELSKRLSYVAISLTFFGILLIATLYGGTLFANLTPLGFVILSLNAVRLGRLVAFDLVFSTYRSPFTVTERDDTGAGDAVNPKGTGLQHALGELVSCPICSGTWATAFTVYGILFFPQLFWNFAVIIATIGAGEIFNAIIELCSWTAQLQRERAGQFVRQRTPAPYPPLSQDEMDFYEHIGDLMSKLAPVEERYAAEDMVRVGGR
jgi:hypothetical protein